MTPPSGTQGERKPAPLGILWIPLALAALAVLALITLATVFPPARVRALAARQLGAMLAREVRFEDAKLGMWPLVRLTIDSLGIAEPGGFANGTALRVRSLHLDLDPLPLFGQRLVIRKFVLEQPTAHIVLRADGTTNLDSLGAPDRARARAPMDLSVSGLEIVQGQVLVDDFAASRRVAFGLESKMSFSLAGRGKRIATAGVSRLKDVAFGPLSAARASDLNRSLARLEWAIDHHGAFDADKRRLALERLELEVGRTKFGLVGTMDFSGETPAVDLSARGTDVDMGQVLDSFSAVQARALEGVRGKGRLDFDLRIRGRLDPRRRPALTGTVRVADGTFRYPGAPVAIENTSFVARLAPDSVAVPDLRARVSGQPVRASIELTRLSDPLLRLGVQGNLDLAAVAPLVAPKDTRLSGQVALDVRGRGRAKDPGAIALEGWARFREVRVEAPSFSRPLERVAGDVFFSPAQSRVKGLTVRAGQSSFTLDATVARPLAMLAKRTPAGEYPVPPSEVDFALGSPYLDLTELVPAGPGGLVLVNAAGSGRVAIGRFKNRKLDVQNVSARVRFQPGMLEVPEFALRGYGGDASGHARFDFPDITRPQITLEARLDSARADAVLLAWTGAGKLLRGSLGGTIKLSTQGLRPEEVRRTLSAAGLAAVREGTLGPTPLFEKIAAFTRVPDFREVRFKDGQVPFRIERGQVATGPTKLTGPHGDWTFVGTVGFDGTLDYAVSITLPPDVVARLGAQAALVAGALKDDQGRVLIDLRVGGNAKSPQVRLDERAMRDRLLGRASGAITQQQEKMKQQLRDALDLAQRAAADSLQRDRQARRSLEDSLKRAARDLLKSFFGGTKDTAGP